MSAVALPNVDTARVPEPRRRGALVPTLARLAWADVLERTRRPGFLVSLLVMTWLAHGMLPAQGASYRTFVINDLYRPAYGSAWVGTLVALLTGLYFMLVGFYLVKGPIERDRRTGVGQILAASKLGRVAYVTSKTLSNLLVLGAMTAVAAGMALVAQQLLGESSRVDVFGLLWPFVWLTLPVALFVSAGAVLWECTPGLRGGFGNVAWFFFFTFILSFSAIDEGSTSPFADLPGGRLVAESVRPAIRAAYPEARGQERSLSMGVNMNQRWRGQKMLTFEWRGLEVTPVHAAARAFWVAIGLGMMLLAAVPFDRFQHTASPLRLPALRLRWPARLRGEHAAGPAVITSAAQLTSAPRTFRFDALLRAELTLMLRGQAAWWWIGFAGLLVAQVFVPMAVLRTALMPIASFWPVFVWSALGHRERRQGTAGILFSSARPEQRLLLASAAAAVLVFVAAGATGLLRLALTGEGAAIAGWLAGALFTAGTALAFGEWTGSAKFFEVVYLFLWYIGPMHKLGMLDTTGVTTSRPIADTLAFAAVGVAGVALAWAGRRRATNR